MTYIYFNILNFARNLKYGLISQSHLLILILFRVDWGIFAIGDRGPIWDIFQTIRRWHYYQSDMCRNMSSFTHNSVSSLRSSQTKVIYIYFLIFTQVSFFALICNSFYFLFKLKIHLGEYLSKRLLFKAYFLHTAL